MAWGPDGRLHVTQDVGSLVAVRRGTRRPVVVARGLRVPLGLVWRGRTLFVSEQGRVERFLLVGGRLRRRRVLVRGLPFGRHQQDNIVVRPDGRLWIGSGSTCDACRDRSRRSAAILSMRQDGSDLRVEARGLRNPYGLALQPETDRLYVSVNGQDELGTVRRPEPAEMVVVIEPGAFYGWPRCWPSYRLRRLPGALRGRHAAHRVSRAALVGRRHRLLHRHFVPARVSRQSLRRPLGPVQLGAAWTARRPDRELNEDGRARRVSEFARGFDHPLALSVDRRGALLVALWGQA